MLLARLVFHQKFPAAYSSLRLARAWLLPTRQTNGYLHTRTLMCRSIQQSSNSSHSLKRLSYQRNSTVVMLVRNCFHYSKAAVSKDILLYKHKSFWLFRLIGAFILAQMSFWTYLLYNSITAGMETRRIAKIKYPDGIPAELINWSSWQGINYKMSTGRWIFIVPFICVSAGL